MAGVTLIDPTLTTLAASEQMAARAETLNGVTIGLLNNGKGRPAERILRFAHGLLAERYDLAGSVSHAKDAPSRPFQPEVLDDVASQCQVAITAVGD